MLADVEHALAQLFVFARKSWRSAGRPGQRAVFERARRGNDTVQPREEPMAKLNWSITLQVQLKLTNAGTNPANVTVFVARDAKV